MAAFLW